MEHKSGNWVYTSEGMLPAPVVGARRARRNVQAVATAHQPEIENTLLGLVALLPLGVAAVALIAG